MNGLQPIADFLNLDPIKGRFISPRGAIGVPWTQITEADGKTEFSFTKGLDEQPVGAHMMIGVRDDVVIGCMMVSTFRAKCRTSDAVNFYCRHIAPIEALIATYRSCETCGSPEAPFGSGINVARRGVFGTWYCEEHKP